MILNLIHIINLILYTNANTPVIETEPLKPLWDQEPILDRYVWLKYTQDGFEKYLTLKGDGTVVVSEKGKYKINDPVMPSLTISEMWQQFSLKLEDKQICNNGYYKPLTVCNIAMVTRPLFELRKTRFGVNIVDRADTGLYEPERNMQDLCLTIGVRIWLGDLETDEYSAIMLPCDSSIEQIFDFEMTEFASL